jgi:hypothetical protein
MFEVIATYRSDFSEQAAARYATLEEAQDAAQRLAKLHRQTLVRVWVRVVGSVKNKN